MDLLKGPHGERVQNIADPYRDLLSELDHGQRMGLVHLLAVGYYEGWRPSRDQVADLVARAAGRLTEEEYLSLLRAPPTVRQHPQLSVESLQLVQGLGPSRPILTPRTDGYPAGQSRPNQPRMLPFTVTCGQVMAPAEFVASGLSNSGWVRRGNGRYRLVTLHYQLIPALDDGPNKPTTYTAPIRCLPDIAAPAHSTDGQTMVHKATAGRVAGFRGPWPVSAAVRHIRFLIYPQSSGPGEPIRHPAGALWVDLTNGQARWRHIVARRAAGTASMSIQEHIQEESSR